MITGCYQLMLTRRDSFCDGGHHLPLLTVDGWETCSGPGILDPRWCYQRSSGISEEKFGISDEMFGISDEMSGIPEEMFGCLRFLTRGMSRAWGFVSSRTVR